MKPHAQFIKELFPKSYNVVFPRVFCTVTGVVDVIKLDEEIEKRYGEYDGSLKEFLASKGFKEEELMHHLTVSQDIDVQTQSLNTI